MAASKIFITGASQGIGRAVALTLASEGHHLCLAARNTDALTQVRDEITSAGGTATVCTVDVTEPEALTRSMREADDDLGGFDTVIANAGVTVGRWSGKMTYEDIAPILDVNVKGAAATMLALLPRMVARKRGHLVGISSLARYRATPKMAAYSASKAFFSAFMEGLRLDLQTTGVAVTDIRPGFVDTELVAGMKRMPFLLSPDQAAQKIVSAIHRQVRVAEFPFPMARLMRTLARLPDAAYERAVRR
jgi:short-subunit dehydrogenase